MMQLLIGMFVAGQLMSAIDPIIVEPSQWSHYEVYRAPSCMKIDGVLSDKEWGKTPAAVGFSDVFKPERAVKQPTAAKIMWDDKYLYIAFECADSDIWGTYTKRDDIIYMEEAVETFIDPEGKGRYYWEVDLSPRNIAVDLMIPYSGWQGASDKLINYDVRGLLTGVKVYGTLDNRQDKDEKWTVEIAIPWADFAGRKVNVPPKDGDSWRLNLFRIDRPGPESAEDQYMSWSKSPGVFHQTKNFGVVTFHNRIAK